MMVTVARSPKSVFSRLIDQKIVVAIPCFNTMHYMVDLIARVKKYADEVIVIDDGSTDMTADVARLAGARVISHGENRGYGEAIKSCIAAAKSANADALIIIDGDGQHNPDEIPDIYRPLYMENADLVIGSRFLETSGKIPGYRKFGIGIINFLWNFGSNMKVSDTQSGCRAYSRYFLEKMCYSEKGMSISIEILEKARRSGVRIKEVPITCSYQDNNGSLSLKAVFHGLSVALAVLRLRFKMDFPARNIETTNIESFV
jgi:glycosyltransferase involved in cell wall biosynthesis